MTQTNHAETSTYEDQFGPARRWLLRIVRAVRWRVKRVTGRCCHILVEARWRLGDEIMAIPIYGALRRQCPNSRITVLCNHPALLEGHPDVDAVNETPATVDRYVLLRGAPRTIRRLEHYARCARVPVPAARPRLHFPRWHLPAWAVLPQGAGAIVAVSAGASWPTKRWPLERWQELCRRLEALGCRVIELGSEEDEAIGVGTSFRGRTTVDEAARLLHGTDLLVCCDSGLMHLALAVGTPALALFGPTDPAILVPGEPKLTVLKVAQDCQGCWNARERGAPPGTCPEGREGCLDSISVEAVLERARRLLAPGP